MVVVNYLMVVEVVEVVEVDDDVEVVVEVLILVWVVLVMKMDGLWGRVRACILGFLSRLVFVFYFG